MQENEKPADICRSVFKSGKDTVAQDEFTKKWIEIINTLEKNKSINFCEKN